MNNYSCDKFIDYLNVDILRYIYFIKRNNLSIKSQNKRSAIIYFFSLFAATKGVSLDKCKLYRITQTGESVQVHTRSTLITATE